MKNHSGKKNLFQILLSPAEKAPEIKHKASGDRDFVYYMATIFSSLAVLIRVFMV